jgi:hypothetical protein
MSTITFSAACRRFERAHDNYWTISKLRPSERQSLGFPFALMDGNHVMDCGDLAAVQRWCREAGVLRQSETVAA